MHPSRNLGANEHARPVAAVRVIEAEQNPAGPAGLVNAGADDVHLRPDRVADSRDAEQRRASLFQVPQIALKNIDNGLEVVVVVQGAYRRIDAQDLPRNHLHALHHSGEGGAYLGVLKIQMRTLLGRPCVRQARPLLENLLPEGSCGEVLQLELQQPDLELILCKGSGSTPPLKLFPVAGELLQRRLVGLHGTHLGLELRQGLDVAGAAVL